MIYLEDFKKTYPVKRLIQGDVGSGKNSCGWNCDIRR